MTPKELITDEEIRQFLRDERIIRTEMQDSCFELIKKFVQSVLSTHTREVAEKAWISVKDKLPVRGQRVIVVQNPQTTSTKESLFAVFDGERFCDPCHTIDGIHLTIGKWVDIIFWQPLPSPPSKP